MLNIRDYKYSNRTTYGIDSITTRYTWAGYFLFVIVSSLIGDTVILIASIKYKAFKLHKMIVVIIQHMAVCDLMVSITNILPILVSVIADEWVFGNILCFLNCFAKYYFISASNFLICTLTTCKLLLLKYPLRISPFTTLKRSHMVCAACWFAALATPVTAFLVDWRDTFFSYRRYACDFGFSSDIWLWLQPLLAVLVLFVPTCLVITTTAYLLVVAQRVVRRGRECLKKQGLMAIILTASVYCISILPEVVYRVGASIIRVEEESKSFFHTHFYRVAFSFIALNNYSNFYIYILTVSSFRAFVWSRLQLSYKFMTYILNIAPSTSHGEKSKLEIQHFDILERKLYEYLLIKTKHYTIIIQLFARRKKDWCRSEQAKLW